MKHTAIQLNTQVWKEGEMYVSYMPQLDISSCGKTLGEAKKNMREAAELFIDEAKNLGTLDQILEEAGFQINTKHEWYAPKFVAFEKMQLAF